MSDFAIPIKSCADCGTQLAPALLACPACHALVHRERLETLARDAEAAEQARDFASATRLWREVFALLPARSQQSGAVAARIEAATKAAQKADLDALRRGDGSRLAKIIGPFLVAGAVLLSKAKLLLLGLTKMGTLLTMFASISLYWTAWGWKFALGVVAGIYVHEMGHVWAMRRRGMRADAPVFVPGVGAFVRMREHAATPAEDAEIGLAGPWWGFAAAIAATFAWHFTGLEFWGAVAHVTAWINLFNLTPVWQLDGSRAFHPFSRAQRIAMTVLIGVVLAVTLEKTLILVGLVALWRAVEKQEEQPHAWRPFLEYAFLLVALGLLCVWTGHSVARQFP